MRSRMVAVEVASVVPRSVPMGQRGAVAPRYAYSASASSA